MKIGDKVRVKTNTWADACRKMISNEVEATVIYIHPQQRFYTVRYYVRGTPLHSSFQFAHTADGDGMEPRKYERNRMVESEKARKKNRMRKDNCE